MGKWDSGSDFLFFFEQLQRKRDKVCKDAGGLPDYFAFASANSLTKVHLIARVRVTFHLPPYLVEELSLF